MIGGPRNSGFDADGIAQAEADHHMKCPGCGQWFDMRDLDQVVQHIHEGDIELVDDRRLPFH